MNEWNDTFRTYILRGGTELIISTLQVFIKKISYSPVRYLVYHAGVNWNDPSISTSKVYIGSTTFGKFFRGKVKFEANSFEDKKAEAVNVSHLIPNEEEFQELAKIEEHNLCSEMYNFLANQETSPAKLEKWLRQRNLTASKRKQYLIDAQKKQYLSLERYLEVIVDRKFFNAKEPWWLVAKSLTYELEKYRFLFKPETIENFSSVSEFVEAHAFNDLQMLEQNYRIPSAHVSNSKIIKQLLGKGFSYGVVEKYLSYLNSNSRSN